MTMIKEEAIAKLVECQKNDDTEIAHSDADDVLCELLNELGYGDVVAEYQKVFRWFA
jgi:pantoate kinase